MKRKFLKLSRSYRSALRTHLKQGRHASLDPARKLGGEVLATGLQTLDLAKLHEQILITEVLPGRAAGKRPGLIRQAGVFFAVAITPIEMTHRGAPEAAGLLKKFIETLSQRTVELAAANLESGPARHRGTGGDDRWHLSGRIRPGPRHRHCSGNSLWQSAERRGEKNGNNTSLKCP